MNPINAIGQYGDEWLDIEEIQPFRCTRYDEHRTHFCFIEWLWMAPSGYLSGQDQTHTHHIDKKPGWRKCGLNILMNVQE